jgi:hypothetical protein
MLSNKKSICVRFELTLMQETKSPVVSSFSSPTAGTNMGMRNSWTKLQVHNRLKCKISNLPLKYREIENVEQIIKEQSNSTK